MRIISLIRIILLSCLIAFSYTEMYPQSKNLKRNSPTTKTKTTSSTRPKMQNAKTKGPKPPGSKIHYSELWFEVLAGPEHNCRIIGCDDLSKLEYLNIPSFVRDAGIEYKVVEINSHAFCPWSKEEAYNKIRKITIPNTITAIGSYAFYGSTELQEVIIPNSVKSIGNWAFEACGKLKKVVLSDNIIKIPARTFYCCENLEEVKLPNSLTEIGKEAFRSCYALKEINLPDSVTKIDESAFSECKNLASIVIPASVKIIGRWGFSKCHNLENLTILSSDLLVEPGAFSGCQSLSVVKCPATVKFASDSFYGLKNVNFIKE